uniref:Uncharacterized protein n=1 Tax=Oryza sativa subsp. japonica TaxID=39947 RepID=Q652R7_ORYSJ|nr:hypothetical protein [Oryza sativa Japonica Group]
MGRHIFSFTKSPRIKRLFLRGWDNNLELARYEDQLQDISAKRLPKDKIPEILARSNPSGIVVTDIANAIPNLPGSRSAVHEACVRWIHRLPGCRSRFTAFRAKDVPFPPSCHRRKGSRHIASPLDLLADQSMVIATARRPRPYLCFRQTHLNTYPPSVYRFVSCVRKDVRI